MTVAEMTARSVDLVANEEWRELDPRDQHRIDCDRSHMCGNNARWGRNVASAPFSYVCSYHRAVYEVTDTYWNEPAKSLK